MKSSKFIYTQALEVNDALQALAAGNGAAKPMSGSQSLGPMLNLRLARPAQVVDVGRIPGLRTVRGAGDVVEIGAAVTHAEIEDGVHEPLADHPMRKVAGEIAYRAIRTRGTVGGSLAHADPAADWVVTLAALDARVRLASPRGEREVQADAFMLGAYTTVLESDELIVALIVPRSSQTLQWGYHKVCRKPGEFAEASAAAYFDVTRGCARIVLGAVDGPPILLHELSAAVANASARREAGAVTREHLRQAIAKALPARDAIDRKLFTACVERAITQSGVLANLYHGE
ncbi:FAD binding domain-containing protein [Noviherbaspirillum galbum]|uniref:Carbon monoxide dehydrogenase n=1 Tax=Noviherbaspirillum galbum TaxID=2709383 RepID=A0A6B3SW10_9BURK|nr:FAD binding domain-containing protein [Noviherbaspirillum galbum]NEX64691.1 carbon monoxide dehydrogenase [Noviherbaspirillum galbum]